MKMPHKVIEKIIISWLKASLDRKGWSKIFERILAGRMAPHLELVMVWATSLFAFPWNTKVYFFLTI